MADSLLDGNTKIMPSDDPNHLVSKGVVLFPSSATDYGTQADLDAALIAFVHRYCDVPPFWERIIVAYVKLTWVFDRFTAIPYLRFLGEWSGGKTRMPQTTAVLAYRSIVASGAMTAAVLFRLIEQFRGTCYLDEADFRSSDLWTEIVKVLNAGYKKNNPVLRCDKDNQPEAFDVFGPKILTTRKRWQDAALESRCITLEVQEKAKIRSDVPYQLPATFDAEARGLRNQLLMWRLRNYRNIQYNESKLRASGLDPRMVEIAAPLTAVSGSDFVDPLIQFLGKRAEEQRADTPQRYIVGAMRDLLGTARSKIVRVKEVGNAANRLRAQEEPDALREAMKHAKPGEEPVFFSAHRAGALIRSLGFKPEHTNSGNTFELNTGRIKELVQRYDPPEIEKGPTRARLSPNAP